MRSPENENKRGSTGRPKYACHKKNNNVVLFYNIGLLLLCPENIYFHLCKPFFPLEVLGYLHLTACTLDSSAVMTDSNLTTPRIATKCLFARQHWKTLVDIESVRARPLLVGPSKVPGKEPKILIHASCSYLLRSGQVIGRKHRKQSIFYNDLPTIRLQDMLSSFKYINSLSRFKIINFLSQGTYFLNNW